MDNLELEKNSKTEKRLLKKIERLEKKLQATKEDIKFYEKVLKRNGFIIDNGFIWQKKDIEKQK